MFDLFREISLPQLRGGWRRTALVVAGVATGVALIAGINVINTTVTASLRATLAAIAGPSDLEVTLGVGEIGFPESVLTTVRGVPGVRTAVALLRGTVSLADAPEETLQLFGVDLTAEDDLQRYRIAAASDRRAMLRMVEEPNAILLTEQFAAARRLVVGSTLRLSTVTGLAPFVVRGLLRPEGLATAFGGQLAVMDIAAAQRWLGKEGRIDQVDVVLADGAAEGDVALRLAAALPATLTVAPPEQRFLTYESILASFQTMLTGLSLLCLVAGVFIIYNTTSTGALHRAVVMAGLRRLGATQRQVFSLFMFEAFVLGALGTAAGLAIGIVLARLLSSMVTDSMGVIFQLRFASNVPHLDVPQLAVIAATGVAATLFASGFAARQVARVDPLQVLRFDTRRPLRSVESRHLVAVWFALVLISVVTLVLEHRFKSIAWGNFGATLWNGSVIVIAIPMVTAVARGLSNVLARGFGAAGEVAAGTLFRAPTRTGVTVAAVALVLTVGMTVASLAYSFHRTTATYVQGFLAGDLIVSAVATEGGWLESPLPETLVDELATVAGVERTGSVRALPGQMFRGERIAIGAVSDVFFAPDRFPPGWYREGDAAAAAPALRAGTAVNISTSFADRFGVHVGDVVDLNTPTGSLALPVVGVVPDLLSDRGSVILSRRILKERWHESTVSRINVFVAKGASLEDVRRGIVERIGDRYRLKILSMRDVLAYHEAKVNSAFAFTDAIQLLVVIVTVAGILDLLLSAIIERRRELGVWRLIGADARMVRRSILLESLSIGVMGAALGVLVGAVTAWIWIGINFRFLLGYYLEHHLAVGATVWYVALVIAMTLLAGYVAARQAVRQPMLDALRTD